MVPCRWNKDGFRYATNISREKFFSNTNRHNARGWPIVQPRINSRNMHLNHTAHIGQYNGDNDEWLKSSYQFFHNKDSSIKNTNPAGKKGPREEDSPRVTTKNKRN